MDPTEEGDEVIQQGPWPVIASGLAAPVPRSRKIRVLCLHGACASGRIMRMQLGVLANVARDDIELIFSDGQLEINRSDPELDRQFEIMMKVFNTTELYQYAVPASVGEEGGTWRTYDKLDEAVSCIVADIAKNTPIDVLLGFSQGSNLANIIAAMSGRDMAAPLRGVVHICTHKPGWVKQKPELFNHKIRVPALVVQGEEDHAALGGEEVAALYENAHKKSHSGDHRPLPRGEEGREFARMVRDWIVLHARDDAPPLA